MCTQIYPAICTCVFVYMTMIIIEEEEQVQEGMGGTNVITASNAVYLCMTFLK